MPGPQGAPGKRLHLGAQAQTCRLIACLDDHQALAHLEPLRPEGRGPSASTHVPRSAGEVTQPMPAQARPLEAPIRMLAEQGDPPVAHGSADEPSAVPSSTDGPQPPDYRQLVRPAEIVDEQTGGRL